MTLLDLMELYQIKHNKAASLDYLVEIINEGEVNPLIDRTQLAVEILRQCGARTPRYNTTDTFKIFGVNFFKLQKDFIDRTLLLIAQNYNALDTYSIERTEKIDRKHTEDIDEQRVDDLETERTDDLLTTRTDNLTDTRTDNLTATRTDNLTATRTDNLTERKTGSYTDEHFVSAENESGVMLRTRDTHADTDPAGSGTSNTGTQTNANTGTQTNANTGTQTNAATGTQTHADTGTQTIANTGSVHNTGLNEFIHDDKIIIGEHGYKISPNVEFFNALKRNEYNLYTEIASKFSDNMCLCVF